MISQRILRFAREFGLERTGVALLLLLMLSVSVVTGDALALTACEERCGVCKSGPQWSGCEAKRRLCMDLCRKQEQVPQPLALALTVSPASPVQEGSQVTLSARVTGQLASAPNVTRFVFTVNQGATNERIASSDWSTASSWTWTPEVGRAAASGPYTLWATAVVVSPQGQQVGQGVWKSIQNYVVVRAAAPGAPIQTACEQQCRECKRGFPRDLGCEAERRLCLDQCRKQPKIPVAAIAIQQGFFTMNLYPVYSHIRCVNCHGRVNPTTSPPQNHGGIAATPTQCGSCHTVPDWRIPRISFSFWYGPSTEAFSAGDICQVVKRSGVHVATRSAFEHHVRDDLLIRWSFAPTPIQNVQKQGITAMSYDNFKLGSMQWFDAGMPCP